MISEAQRRENARYMVEHYWFVRNFMVAMPLLLVGIMLGSFTLLSFAVPPRPSEHDLLVGYALFGWMGFLILVLPRLIIGWVEK